MVKKSTSFFDRESLIWENHPCTQISSGRIQLLNRRTRRLGFFFGGFEARVSCHHPPVPSLTSDAYDYLKVLTHLCYVPVSEDKAWSLIFTQ